MPVTALEKAEEGSCLPRAGSDGIAQPLGPNPHLSLSLHEYPVWSVLSPSLPRTQLQPQLCCFPSGHVLCFSRASDVQAGETRAPAMLGLGACVPQGPCQRPRWGWEGVFQAVLTIAELSPGVPAVVLLWVSLLMKTFPSEQMDLNFSFSLCADFHGP